MEKHMSSALMNLLSKARGDIAAKRGNNVDMARLKDGDMGTPIIFDNDDDNTDSAKAYQLCTKRCAFFEV